jgi:hypothetical protein
MAHEPKQFLKRLAASWRSEFPFLRPVDLDEVPWMPKGCNFLCDAYGASRGCYYFVTVDFSPKRRGQFSVYITVSHSPKKSALGPAWGEPSPTTTGSFGITKFIGKQQFDWALVDLEAQRDALFAKLGTPMPELGNNRHDRIWRPSTYDQPFDKIADEAITHLNHMLRTKVFPVLEIETRESSPA